ncbi:12561_t:CDS:2 [Funneliformis geosporum]|uniref:15222_t:CDS:1 n=1 Tax=Funneliformis geosporum TaxID=1117311 RepID=A0A9W4STM5_9GLOM|nr:15222_t:CDS:2 [Funneliformis geosporum]CAI2181289.1 12561_t:CDS:2 [Funneliformis geosporum]
MSGSFLKASNLLVNFDLSGMNYSAFGTLMLTPDRLNCSNFGSSKVENALMQIQSIVTERHEKRKLE